MCELRIGITQRPAGILDDDRLGAAFRTYATWLVRAARRKLAESGASGNLDNPAGIDLTSTSNNRTNSLNDNELRRIEKGVKND
jgi:hypothetical protein